MNNPALWEQTLFEASARRLLRFRTGARLPVSPAAACAEHSHAAVEIVCHPVGCGITLLDRRRVAFEAGSVVIHAAYEPHDQIAYTKGEDLCVQIALPARINRRLCVGLYLPRLTSAWLQEEIRSLCHIARAADEREQLLLDARATAVLLGLVRAVREHGAGADPGVGERHVRKAEEFIGRRFASIASLREVAAAVGVSHGHLRHLFRRFRGTSLVDCLNEARIARARGLLSASALPLKQVAARCGFRDEHYFSTAFRRRVGVSPGQYRRHAALRHLPRILP